MTNSQRKVLAAVYSDEETQSCPTRDEIAVRAYRWRCPSVDKALAWLKEMYYVRCDRTEKYWYRTPAGEAALMNADKRLLPRDERKLF